MISAFALACFVVSGLCATIRLLRGSGPLLRGLRRFDADADATTDGDGDTDADAETGLGLADRVMALDVALISLMGGLTVDAARRGETTNLIMLVVIAIVGFTATVAASRFMERDGIEVGP